jgi:ribonuclease P protein component
MAETLGRNEVLRRKRDLNRVRRLGLRTGNRFLSLRWARRDEQQAVRVPRRVAFLVPGAPLSAVDRNRLKRRLREIYRRNKDWFPEDRDYLVKPSPAALSLSFAELLEQTRLAATGISANERPA